HAARVVEQRVQLIEENARLKEQVSPCKYYSPLSCMLSPFLRIPFVIGRRSETAGVQDGDAGRR
uniref:Uncharacterized protein n=1 Tax=Aegilops tauschii subsp. strangulata TaxID=200361 RepID=A0A453IY31_AEGTS